MGKLDYRDYYECSKCKTRIHQSMAPNSISGEIKCCGQTMTGPGDPILGYAFTSIVCGTPVLWYFTPLGFWFSLGITALFAFVVLCPILMYIRNRKHES